MKNIFFLDIFDIKYRKKMYASMIKFKEIFFVCSMICQEYFHEPLNVNATLR